MYQSNTTVAVFTAWPELIHDAHKICNVVFQEPVDSLVINTFRTPTVNLERYVVRVHDYKLHSEFDCCLFVNQPVGLDMSDLLECIDPKFTTYFDQDQQFILYRRDEIWRDQIISVEKYPPDCGVIFIDCWQYIMDHSEWPNVDPGFDWYESMSTGLFRHKNNCLVFCTGDFGSLLLSNKLQSWKQQYDSIDCWNPQYFQQYYQSKKLYNWIVAGAHWQRCTHDKPLGFYNLLKLKQQDSKLRIFSHSDCTLKFLNDDIEHPRVAVCNKSDYDQDTLKWKSTGKLFELML
jgi:hypothetical protein